MKYLRVADDQTALATLRASYYRTWPNWESEQLTKHQNRPDIYPHPDTYANDPLSGCGWVRDDDTGECEVWIPESEEMRFTGAERAAMTDAPGLDIAEEGKNRSRRPN